MADPNDRCVICNGTRQEHSPHTHHAFSMTPGDLRPRQESQPTRRLVSSEVVERLIALLLDKEIISDTEALRCFGVENPNGMKLQHQPVADSAMQLATRSVANSGHSPVF